jgi:hypothetical protein
LCWRHNCFLRCVWCVGVGSGAAGVWLMPCAIDFSLIRDSLTIVKFVEICRTLFESLMVSNSVEICRSLYIWSNLIASVLTVLEVVCELRLICLGSRSTGDHHFWLKELFLDSDEPITFYSRSEVIVWWHFYGSGCCILRWSGSCRVSSSKIEIRSRPLLGGVWFGLFIGVLLIYGAFVFVACLLRVSARLVQRLDYL